MGTDGKNEGINDGKSDGKSDGLLLLKVNFSSNTGGAVTLDPEFTVGTCPPCSARVGGGVGFVRPNLVVDNDVGYNVFVGKLLLMSVVLSIDGSDKS